MTLLEFLQPAQWERRAFFFWETLPWMARIQDARNRGWNCIDLSWSLKAVVPERPLRAMAADRTLLRWVRKW